MSCLSYLSTLGGRCCCVNELAFKFGDAGIGEKVLRYPI